MEEQKEIESGHEGGDVGQRMEDLAAMQSRQSRSGEWKIGGKALWPDPQESTDRKGTLNLDALTGITASGVDSR